jgi:crotonobetainyl-CoA:carnitine CoA-transferase CaiB-like acyl-CoA transferase
VEILSDIRVVEFATEIAGPYCGKLFADVGADVVKVEPEAGDPLRHRAACDEELGPMDAALFRFLNAAKRSVIGDPEDDEMSELIGSADVVLESFIPARLDVDALRNRFPHLVIVSVTPYGRGGSWETRPTTEFVVQAESGGTGGRGEPDRPPVYAGGRLSEWIMGAYAGVAALAAVLHARRTGRGEYIDCSQHEATTLTFTTTTFNALTLRLTGNEPVGPARRGERPSIEPTADGWVGFNTNTRQMFESFLLMIERPDLIGDDRFAFLAGRSEHAEEWDAIVHAWTRTKTTGEIVELASLLRIPVAPVNDARAVLEHEQFAARHFFVPSPEGDFLQPLPPYTLDGDRPVARRRAPLLGEHTGRIEPRPSRPAPPRAKEASELPLAGVRVLDATSWWAGPSSTQLLAYLGADVIHLESITRPDGGRTPGTVLTREQWWEFGALYIASNTNKRGVTLSLDVPHGSELVRQLAASADAVIENFSPRVFEQYGLTWDTLHTLNPRTIFVRMPGFGTTGPWRDNVGFAQTMEQMSGMAWVTGYSDGPPRIPQGPCDPNAGAHAAFALLVSLAQRERTGLGSYVESTMVEAALNAAAEQTIVYSAYGKIMMRDGNRGPDAAPQGIYACRGEENWLALSVKTDVQWRSMVGALGEPAWATMPALATARGRHMEHDLLDERLAKWAQEQDLDVVVAQLIDAGVPAGRVADPRTISSHPRHVERGWFEKVDHKLAGPLPLPGPPFRYASVDAWQRSASPFLGEHNHEVFVDILGLSEAEVDHLEATGVAGNRLAN